MATVVDEVVLEVGGPQIRSDVEVPMNSSTVPGRHSLKLLQVLALKVEVKVPEVQFLQVRSLVHLMRESTLLPG